MTNLKTVHGLNTYCGPAVISAITGEPTERCAAAISAVSGRKEIKAVEWKHLIQTFLRLRFDCKQVMTGSTLYGTIVRLSATPGFYVIGVPKHVVAIEVVDKNSVWFIDNHSKEPLKAEASARLGQSVDIAYRVVPKDPPKFVSSTIQVRETPYRFEVYRQNKFENPDDDTQSYLGSVQYESSVELKLILNSLQEKFKP